MAEGRKGGEVDLTNWPKHPDYPDRFVCAADKPMPAGADGLWVHVNAISDGECSEGCCDDYFCISCKTRWRVECAE